MKIMDTELQIFSKMTLDSGGIWVDVAQTVSCSYTMYKTQSAYWEHGHKYYNSPVYQIFDDAGKRVYAGMNYVEAYDHMRILGDTQR